MSLFSKLIGRDSNVSKSSVSESKGASPTFIADGIRFSAAKEPTTYAEKLRFASFQQLLTDGLVLEHEGGYLMSWSSFYALAELEGDDQIYSLLGLPRPSSELKPVLGSSGSLSDADFKISIMAWIRSSTREHVTVSNRVGGAINIAEEWSILSFQIWRLCELVKSFAARSAEEKSQAFNQAQWAVIRKLAIDAGVDLDGFLESTIVLRPENLNIDLRKSSLKTDSVLEVIPGFEGQPENWLDVFDRTPSVPDHYRINTPDGRLVHLTMTPEVKTVLMNIKQMPARRVAGDSAMRFLKNPFAALGEDASSVIEPQQFEGSREKAGIHFYRFSIVPVLADEKIASVQVYLSAKAQEGAEDICLEIERPADFRKFVDDLVLKVISEVPFFFWRGYELDLSDITDDALAGLVRLSDRWLSEETGALFEGVFDLEQYGDRVIGIGVAEPVSSPYIQKENPHNWIPPEVLRELGVDADLLAKLDETSRADFDEFCSRIQTAKEEQTDHVFLPRAEAKLSIDLAEQVRDAWAKKFPGDTQQGAGAKQKKDRSILLVQKNILDEEYVHKRAEDLGAAKSSLPALPNSLKSDVSLREHQLQGLAWLQGLFHLAPKHNSGCVLADDMGLGKTLQILSFLISIFEHKPDSKPALIVAPVSLLDNWEREFQRFFDKAPVQILRLYGDAVRAKKFTKAELPDEIRSKGITNLLRPGWRGDCQIVLATYETIRDLEFSLARQKWSVLVFDEAQKIKNPAALVTQAAMAIPADFKVACTGTPVENSLTDLWCLFDLVQPSALGSLSSFGRRFIRPIENGAPDAPELRERLKAMIEPQILRRTKADVAKDLPAKIVDASCKRLAMGAAQRKLYEERVAGYGQQKAVNAAMGEQSALMLGLLHNLKIICAHPPAYQSDLQLVTDSPKMIWLVSQLEAIKVRGEKVIIFTEFRDLQRALQVVVYDRFGIAASVVNGDTNASAGRGPNRQQIIDRFQEAPGFNVIILSTTAVGFGVNIQAANHVIHFTRPWNPAKEDQATDRSYRIGQTKDVVVYYPTVVADGFTTFEETLDALLERKRGLASDMLTPMSDVDLSVFEVWG